MLVAVDSISLKKLSTKQAAQLLGGAKGTKVKLTLVKANGTKFSVSLTRQMKEEYENIGSTDDQDGNFVVCVCSSASFCTRVLALVCFVVSFFPLLRPVYASQCCVLCTVKGPRAFVRSRWSWNQ